jgi:hypothetical protein
LINFMIIAFFMRTVTAAIIHEAFRAGSRICHLLGRTQIFLPFFLAFVDVAP